jgi:predicted transcriptional regulator
MADTHSVRLAAHLRERLDALASQRHCTRSDIIRQLIEGAHVPVHRRIRDTGDVPIVAYVPEEAARKIEQFARDSDQTPSDVVTLMAADHSAVRRQWPL